MKTTTMAVTIAATMGFLAIMATKASSMDFSVAGQTLSIGADSDMNYTTGVEEWEWELTPSAGITAMGIGLSVATDIDMLELDEGDIFLFKTNKISRFNKKSINEYLLSE